MEFPHKDGTLQCHISVSRTLFNEKRRLASTYVGLNNLQQIKPIILHTLLLERIWLQLYHWLTYLLPSDFRVKSEIIIVNMVSWQPKKHMFKKKRILSITHKRARENLVCRFTIITGCNSTQTSTLI